MNVLNRFTPNHQKLLFLCTGNYYRSRFAEYLFNALAEHQGLAWRADSRGVAIEFGRNNLGPLSPYTIRELIKHGIHLSEEIRLPLQATEADFASADKIIALDESEHRPLIATRFPQWLEVVEYWKVHDIDKTLPAIALQQIVKHIHHLLLDLR
jgi:protein-tyrosine phosphatase